MAKPREQHFTYRPLDHNKAEFRLLKLSAGPVPCCTIDHFSLETAPPYKAVSYRWGAGVATSKIMVNGLPLEISANLLDFLLQHDSIEKTAKLRDGKHSVDLFDDPIKLMETQWAASPWIWIDQLCIDQWSISEKNHQVAQMGIIYSQALQVLVWLGNGTDGTEEAVTVAGYIAEAADITEGWEVRHANAEERAQFQISDFEACQKIASNEYWSRLWIIQEFVLARTVVIMSGSAQIYGAHFQDLAKDVAREEPSPLISRIWPFLMARRRLTAQYKMQRMAYRDIGEVPTTLTQDTVHYTWQDMISLARKAECRDVRDRIYGMLSMVKQQVRIQVDYTAPAREIREKIIEVEFTNCYDRPFSQSALEEVDDEDFERFIDDLDSALELKDHIGDANDHLGDENADDKRSCIDVPKQVEYAHSTIEQPKDNDTKRARRLSLFRHFSTARIRAFMGYQPRGGRKKGQ